MNADVRQEIQLMESIGWQQDGPVKSHIKMRHKVFGQVVVPCSPSDHRWRMNHRAEVARKMKMTLNDLLGVLGLRAPKNPDRIKKRERGRPKGNTTDPIAEQHDRRVLALHGILNLMIERRLDLIDRINAMSGPSSDAAKVQSEIHDLQERKRMLDLEPPTTEVSPKVIARSEATLERALRRQRERRDIRDLAETAQEIGLDLVFR